MSQYWCNLLGSFLHKGFHHSYNLLYQTNQGALIQAVN